MLQSFTTLLNFCPGEEKHGNILLAARQFGRITKTSLSSSYPANWATLSLGKWPPVFVLDLCGITDQGYMRWGKICQERRGIPGDFASQPPAIGKMLKAFWKCKAFLYRLGFY